MTICHHTDCESYRRRFVRHWRYSGEATCADSGSPCESSHLGWASSLRGMMNLDFIDITYAIQTHKKSCLWRFFLYPNQCDLTRKVSVCSLENEKTTRQGGFSKVQETGKFLNRGNCLGGDESPNLSFQCSRSLHCTSRTLSLISSISVTSGYRQWRFVVSVRVGLKRKVT